LTSLESFLRFASIAGRILPDAPDILTFAENAAQDRAALQLGVRPG